MDEKQQINLEVPYREKISRLFIFRALWVYILIFPMIPTGLILGLVGFVHFLYMLVLGKRHEGMWNIFKRVFTWVMQWQAYLQLLVDKRPGFWW